MEGNWDEVVAAEGVVNLIRLFFKQFGQLVIWNAAEFVVFDFVGGIGAPQDSISVRKATIHLEYF